jgi:chromosome partitioning protein
MPDVIAILNQKGGAGKTTLATNLATWAARQGLRVLLADADPQATARNWRERAPEDSGPLPVVAGADAGELGELDTVAAGRFDVVIIDGPPGLTSDGPSKRVTAALQAAAVALIPVRPSAADVWASDTLVKYLAAHSDALEPLQAAYVVSAADSRTNVAEEVREALEGRPLPLLDAGTGDRVAYAEALGSGLSVMDLEPGGAAADEIDTLAREIQTRFHVFQQEG